MQSLSAYTMSLTSQAVACKDLSSWLTAMGRHLLGDCFVARVPCSCVVFERVPCWQQVWKPNYQGLAHDTLMQLVRARALCKAGVTVLPIWGCPGNNVHFPAHLPLPVRIKLQMAAHCPMDVLRSLHLPTHLGDLHRALRHRSLGGCAFGDSHQWPFPVHEPQGAHHGSRAGQVSVRDGWVDEGGADSGMNGRIEPKNMPERVGGKGHRDNVHGHEGIRMKVGTSPGVCREHDFWRALMEACPTGRPQVTCKTLFEWLSNNLEGASLNHPPNPLMPPLNAPA
eukprot:1151827-Pelagomonas_calceolata.AAC.1